MRIEKKVRMISLDKRYRKHPYYFTVPISDTTGKYVTGQEVYINEEQMLGKKELTKATRDSLEMGDQPVLINPFNQYPLTHGRTFNLSYDIDDKGVKTYLNPKDFAEFTFFCTKPEIATSKDVYVKERHCFYIEDKVREAEFSVMKEDKAFEAENFVRTNMKTGRYKDLLILLSYNVKGYSINPEKLSEIETKARVIEACRKYPEEVLKFKANDTDETLFILKLMKYMVMEKRSGTDIYYGEEFVGGSLENVRSWIHKPEHAHLVTKWGKMIQEKEGSIPVEDKKKEEKEKVEAGNE